MNSIKKSNIICIILSILVFLLWLIPVCTYSYTHSVPKETMEIADSLRPNFYNLAYGLSKSFKGVTVKYSSLKIDLLSFGVIIQIIIVHLLGTGIILEGNKHINGTLIALFITNLIIFICATLNFQSLANTSATEGIVNRVELSFSIYLILIIYIYCIASTILSMLREQNQEVDELYEKIKELKEKNEE